jgi:hypothetical protein
MSKTSKWVLVLGLMVSLLGGSAGSAWADDGTPPPPPVVANLLGPGVCC